MKTIGLKIIGCAVALASFGSINAQQAVTVDSKYTLVDLATGEKIAIYYDTVAWKTINKTTSQPVEYYIIQYNDNTPADTVHGVTGIIVNNLITNSNGQWMFNDTKVKWDGSELKMKDRYGRKVKWEKGELKIKDWNSKYKADSKEKEAKYKEDWDKIKWKENEMKIEEGTKKTKIESGS